MKHANDADSAACVDDVLITPELARRPSRPPDYAAENRALNTLSQEMATHPERVMQKVAEVAMELCHADSAGISVLEAGGEKGIIRWHVTAGAFAPKVDNTIPRDATPCGTVLERNQVLLFDKAERFFPTLRSIKPQIHETLLAPWVVNDAPLGTLWVIKHAPEARFDREDARLLASFARFASAAWQILTAFQSVRNAQHQLEQRVDERTRELRHTQAQLEADVAGMRKLYEVNARIATEPNLKTALDEILAAACEFTHTDRGCVQLVSEDDERLEMFTWRGYPDNSPFIQYFRHEGFKEGCDTARIERRRIIIEDALSHPELVGTEAGAAAAADEIRAAQSTPMVSRHGETVGVLSTQFREPHRPSDDALRLVDLLAWTGADFVERYRAEAALRASEERFRLLVENVQEYALFQTDSDDKVISWNPGAQRLFGYSSAEIIGESADQLFTPEDQAAGILLREISRVMQGQREESARSLVRKDGSKFWARWVSEPIRDDSGHIRGVARILRDETERRHADEAIRLSLAEKEALLKEVHHRVKNNLQVIVSLLNMQARQIDIDHVLNLFEETRNRVQSIANIHELLYRGETFATIELSLYARQLAPDLVRFYGLQERVSVRVIGDGATLELERAVPYGILINELISNACKHAFTDGRTGEITITIRAEGNQIEMSVADNGKGMPAGFDYRRTPTLGLKLVRGLVGQLRGTFEMRSESGTIVTVRFPVAVTRADA